MRALPSRLGLLGTVALAGLPAPADAQMVGEEFQVNTYTTSSQQLNTRGGRHIIASDASGNFVVVWESFGQDGSYDGVFGQRYDSAGDALGTEFRVNSYTTQAQYQPSVASDRDGNFVVVWQSYAQFRRRGWDVFGQRFDSWGEPLGSEFRVNASTTQDSRFTSVASDRDGNFVVAWTSQTFDDSTILARRYDSGGSPQGNPFRVNSYTTSDQVMPSVASDVDGNFVVVWESGSSQDGSGFGIFGQRYDSEGVGLGAEFQINSYTTGHQLSPSVAYDANGNFIVVWTSQIQDGSSNGVFGQRYDSAGAALGSEFQVNTYATLSQDIASVAGDADGNFLVVWMSFTQDGNGLGIFAQHYDSSGTAQGGEFRVNSYTTSKQKMPSVWAVGLNQFVVAWESYTQDGSSYGVFGQRFDFGGGPTIHAGDLDRKAKNVDSDWRAHVKTLVHDNGHNPESGVLVTFNVSGGVGMRTCTTVASGVCEVSVVVPDSVPSLTFVVTNLSKAGFTYTPAANHDPDPDSDGTVIVVNQP